LATLFLGSFVLGSADLLMVGSLNGLFVAVTFVAGIAIVPPERAGQAISVVFSGFSVSAATGAPLGTLLGQALGWRNSFVALAVFSVVTAIATLVLVPSLQSAGGGASHQARYAFAAYLA
jgi:MFS transporter, DHA1 family, inner membrane transport protein